MRLATPLICILLFFVDLLRGDSFVQSFMEPLFLPEEIEEMLLEVFVNVIFENTVSGPTEDTFFKGITVFGVYAPFG